MSIPLNFNPLGFTPAEPSELPKGYTRLAFLGCDGAQWVDSGFTADNATSVKCTYFPGTPNGLAVYAPFGARESYRSNEFDFFVYFVHGYTRACRGTGFSSNYVDLGYSAELSTVEFTPEYASLLGESKAWNHNDDFETPHTLLVGAMQSSQYGVGDPFHGRLYEFIMWTGDVEQCNLVPAVDPMGVPCMFDKTATAPKYNLGSRPFTTGIETLDQLRQLARNLPSSGGSLSTSFPAAWNGNASANALVSVCNKKGWTLTITYRDASEDTSATTQAGGENITIPSYIWARAIQSEAANYQDADGLRYYVETCHDVWHPDGLSPDDLGYTSALTLEDYLTERGLTAVVYEENEEELMAEASANLADN